MGRRKRTTTTQKAPVPKNPKKLKETLETKCRGQGISIATLIVAIVALIVAVLAWRASATERTQKEVLTGVETLLESNRNVEESVVDIYNIFNIDPEKTDLLFVNGMTAYNNHDYDQALVRFQEALPNQEKLTGATSVEVGKIYSMIGLSKVYSTSYSTDDAASDFSYALEIFERLDEYLYIAWCHYFMGTAYFEDGDNQLDTASHCVQYSIDALMLFYPDDSAQKNEDGEYDLETVYKAARFHELMQNNENLLGKIHFRQNYPALSFFYFNTALKSNALWVRCYSDLLYNRASISESTDTELRIYVEQYGVSEFIDNLTNIRIYDFSMPEDYKHLLLEQVDYFNATVSSSSETATILTNRAMAELPQQYYGEATYDCETALEIWKGIHELQRDTISDTYKRLSEILMDQESENKELILSYLDWAVAYDKKYYGDYPRTANSLYERALAHAHFDEFGLALKDCLEAYRIYRNIGNWQAADQVEDSLKRFYEAVYDDENYAAWLEHKVA